MEKRVPKSPVRVVVLDLLKPHKPDILELGKEISRGGGVDVNISVYAVDEKTESAKLSLAGRDIDLEKIRKVIEDNGAVIHSIDKVVIGSSHIIETPPEPQPTK